MIQIVHIYDEMGKMVKIGTIFAPYQISVIDLPIGTYVLRINHAEVLISGGFSVEEV